MGSFSIFRSFNAKAPWRVDFYTHTYYLFNWVLRNLQNLSNPYIYRGANTIRNNITILFSYLLTDSISLSLQMAFSNSMAFLATALVLLPMATFALDWPDISPSIEGKYRSIESHPRCCVLKHIPANSCYFLLIYLRSRFQFYR